MPLLIVMAGAYVAYKTNLELSKKQLEDGSTAAGGKSAVPCPTDYHLDPSINRRNKAYIRLLPVEVELCLFELPITTLSFFEGSYETAAIHIQARMRAILAKNPWLGGWLIRDEDDNYELKLLYDETGQDICQGYFQVYEPYVIPVGRNFDSYHDLGKKMDAMGATIPTMNAKIIGQNNRPIWKVSIIPDVDAPSERFSLAFSMSHVVADAHSYYKIFAMLDQDVRIEALQPMRNFTFPQELAKHTGKDEADFVYLRKVLERQPPPPGEPWHQRLMHQQQQQQKHPELQVSKNARARNPLACSRRNTERVVFKMFFVNEDWLLSRKGGGGQQGRQGRRSSVYDVQTYGASGSTTAGTASSTTTKATAAGNVSANSIITSWFFNLTKPSLGLMATNMRNRVDGIGANDMGNYVHTILYTPVDYQTPALIQESLSHLRRCGSDPISALPDLWETNTADKKQQQVTTPVANNNDVDDKECTTNDDTGDIPATPTPPPPTPATLTSSISINWARYCPEREIYLVPDGSEDDNGSKHDDGGPLTCLNEYCGGGLKDIFPDAAANRSVYAEVNDNAAMGSTAGASSAAAAAAVATEEAAAEEAAAATANTTTTNDKNGNTITQTLHIPFFTFQELEIFPDTLSCIAIFTASPRGQHSPERRPGAWLICKESLWLSEIQHSGIVEEMIAEMNL